VNAGEIGIEISGLRVLPEGLIVTFSTGNPLCITPATAPSGTPPPPSFF